MGKILMVIGLILAMGPVLILVYSISIPVGIAITRFIDIFDRTCKVR